MDVQPTDGVGAPPRWFIVFRRKSEAWWVSLLARGRYKHVRAFAFVPECDAWVFFDPGWGRWSLFVARGKGAQANIAAWTDGGDVLSLPGASVEGANPAAFLCTSAIRRLVGIPGGALLPTRLWRDCLAHGATIVHGQAADPDRRADRPDA